MEKQNLRKKLLGIPLILFLFLTIFSVCGIILLYGALWKNIKETNENYLSHYMAEIEKSLDSYRLMVANNGMDEKVLKDLNSIEEKSSFYAKLSLSQEWNHLLELYPEIDGIYVIGEEEKFFFINPKSNYEPQNLVRSEILSWAKELSNEKNPFEDGWMVLKTGDSYFLQCSVLQDKTLFGIWIWSEKFLNFFQEYREKGENEVLFTQKTEEETQKKNFSSKYFMITKYFEGEEFGLSLLVEKEKMISPVRHILWIFLLLGIVALSITIIYILILYKAILQIEDLNQTIYEEKIWGLKLKQQVLKLQIKPHFCLNSLSTILSFLYVGEIQPAEKMIVYLANHIRYLLNGDSFIRLGDEITHIKNYMAMQRLRFGENFSCKISIPPELEECFIPILCIQTFVENSIKHATKKDGNICIFLSAFSIKKEDESYIKILIEDDAGGFDPKILAKLQSGESLHHENKSHIGISNVRERIKWIYGEKGNIYLSNGKFHGALIEIVLPLSYKKLKRGNEG